MKDFLRRWPLLIGLLLFVLAWVASTWVMSGTSEGKGAGRNPAASGNNKPSAGSHPTFTAPRSIQGLTVDDKHDISADGRPPNARREGIIRTGLGEIQEMQQMNKAVFDDAAKRWNAQPRVKELIAQWKELEEAWKTQEDEAKEVVVPRMESMWKEALGLLREEVEKTAREADTVVK
jgi:hypothetical protein